MKRSILRTKLILVLVALVFAMFSSAIIGFNSANKVKAEGENLFQMVNSVKLRLDGDGMAFVVKMDEATKTKLADGDKTLYFIIMPEKYLNNVKVGEGYDYSMAIERKDDGSFDDNASHCLYVNVESTLYKENGYWYASGGVEKVLTANKKLNFIGVACIETKLSATSFTYEYATLPEELEQMPTISEYKAVINTLLFDKVDYSDTIGEHYSWLGTAECPIEIDSISDYNKLVAKVNSNQTSLINDLVFNISSDVNTDSPEATPLESGKELPTSCEKRFSNVNFYDDLGKLISSVKVENGTTATPIANPSKENNVEFTFAFDKWVTELGGNEQVSFSNVSGNIDAYAKFTATKNKYTITWIVDGVSSTTQVEYGTVPSFGETPTKAEDESATYTFSKWDVTPVACSGNATYTAEFTKTVKPSYAFINMSKPTDLALLSGTKCSENDKGVESGDASYSTATQNFSIISASDAVIGNYAELSSINHSGAFFRINFQTELGNSRAYFENKLEGFDKVVFYIYNPDAGNINFYLMQADWVGKNHQQSLNPGWNLITIEKQSFLAACGDFTGDGEVWGQYLMFLENGAFNGKTVKISSFYAYTNEGYNNNFYKVQFKNGDAVLQESDFFYGTMPVYSGETPTKASDSQYSYSFKGWDNEISLVTGATTYNAQFNSEELTYTITWKKNASDTGITEQYKYGETPSYKGETLANYLDGEKYYECVGFGTITPVDGDKTYVCEWAVNDVIRFTMTGNYSDSGMITNLSITGFTGGSITIPSMISRESSTDFSKDMSTDFRIDKGNYVVLRVNSTSSTSIGDIATFYKDTVIKKDGKYLALSEDVRLVRKPSGLVWAPFKEFTITGGWFENFMYTTMPKAGITEKNQDVPGVSSREGDKSMDTRFHTPSDSDFIAFRVDSSGNNGDIVTFYKGTLVEIDGKCFMFSEDVRLMRDDGYWKPIKEFTIESHWFGSYGKDDYYITSLPKNGAGSTTIYIDATSSINGAITIQAYIHQAGEKDNTTIRLDKYTKKEGNVDFAPIDGEIITFGALSGDTFNRSFYIFPENSRMIYKNNMWCNMKEINITGSWFGQWVYTDMEKGDKDEEDNVGLSFTATSSLQEGNVTFSVLAHHPGEKDVIVFRVDYLGTAGEVITFNNSGAVYHGVYLYLPNGLQLTTDGSTWTVVK